MSSTASVLEPHLFPDCVGPSPSGRAVLGGRYRLEVVEREHIVAVIARSRTLDEAAEILGIDTSTLWRRRKKYEEEAPGSGDREAVRS
jgi:NtrC-family two-component system response regulator AlgB